MDGVAVVRVVKQVQVLRYVNINQPNAAAPLIQQQQAQIPAENNRCLNAFVLLVIYTIGIGSIVLGAVHLNDCPAQKMLPTCLVIFGGMMMVSRLLNCVEDCRNICEQYRNGNIHPCLAFLNFLFGLAEFGMFIAICYWTFNISPTTKPEDHDLPNYCHYGLYKTSFYGCIVGLILYSIPIFCCCCLACCKS